MRVGPLGPHQRVKSRIVANDSGRPLGSRHYNARLTKSSLRVPECRIVARELLARPAEDAVAAILRDNLLQKRSLATARTLVSLLATRLTTVDRVVLDLVVHGDATESVLAVMAATMKAETLLADFVGQVVGDVVSSYGDAIPPSAWRDFIEACADRDPRVRAWTPEVVAKLRQNVYRILAEAGYVHDTATMRIQRVIVPKALSDVLVASGDEAVLGLLRVTE